MKSNYKLHLLQLLLATFFISTSGVLGRYIAMPTEVIIWFRSFFGMLALFLFCKVKKYDLKVQRTKDYRPFLIASVFMAVHWITYFYALKISNVAIGILSLYTFPVIIALLEPFFLKIKFNPIHIVLGCLVLLGLYILVPEFSLESSSVKGVLFGLVSALFYAIRILILKQYVHRYNGSVLMLYQTIVITVILLPFLFIKGVDGWQEQLPYLILLGLLTTAIGHGLMTHSLQFFSASTASIISSIQPIFGIFLAVIFLNEIPTKNTYFGGLLILATVIIESIRSRKK